MKILAFDTCNAIASVAIMHDDIIVASVIELEHSKQAENLILMIDECLKKANLSLNDMDYIAVTIGPGSFTGCRIGLSAAKGLALAMNKEIIAVTCFEALAYNYLPSKIPIIVAMDARRGELFTQKFVNFANCEDYNIETLEEFYEKIRDSEIILVGEGSKLVSQDNHFQVFNPLLEASLVAKAAKIKIDNDIEMLEASPLYIREANARKLV